MIHVTMLSEYIYCPRKLYLRYVLKFVPTVTSSVVRGNIEHDFFDLIKQKEEDLILSINFHNLNRVESLFTQLYKDVLEELIANYEEDLEKVQLDKENFFSKELQKVLFHGRSKAKLLRNFIDQTGLLGEELIESLPLKYETEVKLSSRKLKLKGIVDRIEIIDGSYIPVELKTGAMPIKGIWPAHKIQLGAYILLMREKFNSNFGYVHYLDFNSKRKVVMNPFLEEEIKNILNYVSNILKSDKIPDVCKNKKKCFSCGFKNYCDSNSESL